MSEITAGVDWIAVIVGTVLAFLLGWLWFSPLLFGKKWAEGVGIELGSASKMPVAPMILQLVATFFLSWAVGVAAVHYGLMAVILIVVTIILIVAANGLFILKNHFAIAVEAGFIAAMAVLMILAQQVL